MSGSSRYLWLHLVSYRFPAIGGLWGDALISLTRRNLALQMPLLVIQILQLQVQPIHLLARLSGLCLGVAGAEGGLALEAAQLGEVAVE